MLRQLPARPLVLFAVVVSCLASAAGAHAQSTGQTPPSPSPPKTLMTPYFALGDDLAPGGGAAFAFRWTQQLSVEAEASLGRDAARSSLSLLYALPEWGRFTIHLAGGGGVQRDEFDDGTELFVTKKKTEFAVNIGTGASVPVTTRWAFRSDFRWYNPKAEWPESWRVFSGLTFVLRR